MCCDYVALSLLCVYVTYWGVVEVFGVSFERVNVSYVVLLCVHLGD